MSDLYFGDDVDQSIALFMLETDEAAKHKIFIEDIKPAFDKLVNYHFYRSSGVVKDEDAKHDCLSFLYEVLRSGKFKIEKYERGFPYFNMVTKNFFIQQKKNISKKAMIDKNLTSLGVGDSSQINEEYLATEDFEEEYETREFITILKEHLPKWRDQFQKDQEKEFVDALIKLFDTAENIDIYKKKAIFFYLREITGLNSKQVATNLNKVKKKFLFLKRKYNRGDI